MTYIDQYLPTTMLNLLELDAASMSSGLVNKLTVCLPAIAFPLPQYQGDVEGYFNNVGCKKRSHFIENPSVKKFYAAMAPEYLKLSTLSNCKDYLTLKQDLAGTLASQRIDLDADRQHIQQFNYGFVKLIKVLYRNTSKSPSDFPKYV